MTDFGRKALWTVVIFCLAGCDPFYQPLGARLDDGNFGNATAQNRIAQKNAYRTNPVTYSVRAQTTSSAAQPTPEVPLQDLTASTPSGSAATQ